jgi:DNA-binding FrmR family transcriptional regulator
MNDEMKQIQQDLNQLNEEFGINAELYLADTPDCCRHKSRDLSEYEALLKRLNRIEGQVRGVRGMVEKECYCTDILTQVSAIQSALNAFSRELLANHIRTCVVDGIRSDDTDIVDELVRTVEKLMK